MFCSRSKKHTAVITIQRILFVGSLCLLSANGLAKPHAAPVKPPVISRVDKPDPEALLIDVYKELGANHLRAAQTKADALVATHPNFLLGHLIRGDLLLMHTRSVTTFGAMATGSDEKVKNLREEAMVRLRSLRERPDPDLVPRSILQLREDQKFALVVDARRSRLYVYENQGGELKFVADYYVSQGKLGVNKNKAGDQKTPIGIYYITSRLPGAKLPDLYGAGALPINYPNEWDRLNGRSGSGIWLHGTPSGSYSRPPLSSDGCVVLTNPDLHKLYTSVEIGKTPVVISEQVEFVNAKKRDSDRNIAVKLVETWRLDLESLDPARLMSNYSSKFKSDRGENLNTWFVKSQQILLGARKMSVKLRDVTLFLYPGRDDLMVGTFTEDALINKNKNSVRKRQYWAKEGAQWKIVSESSL